jgi:polyphosphate kinase
MKRLALDDPRYYFNRHVQWLEFNRRVLEEARDIGNPLLERVKFLAITANNLDEFVEVRVSSFLHRERICTEIPTTCLADTRKARLLGPDGKYSRPRAVPNGHGFSAQEHLMRLAARTGDTQRTRTLRGSVVYPSKDVAADPSPPEADTTAQDSSNAAV